MAYCRGAEDPAVALTGHNHPAWIAGLRVLGCQQLELRCPLPPGYRYPDPVNYQVYLAAWPAHMAPFRPTKECRERAWLPPEATSARSCVQRHPEFYGAALAVGIARQVPGPGNPSKQTAGKFGAPPGGNLPEVVETRPTGRGAVAEGTDLPAAERQRVLQQGAIGPGP